MLLTSLVAINLCHGIQLSISHLHGASAKLITPTGRVGKSPPTQLNAAGG